MQRWTHIRFAVAFVVASAALACIWLIPGGASTGSSAREKPSTSDCEALQDIGDETPDVEGSDVFDSDELSAYATGLENTAKNIDDSKLRNAMNTVAAVYEDASKARNKAGALAVIVKSGKKWIKANALLGKSVVQCAAASITLPTLPRNVTLPGGITIPTLPR
jgi:hypothetical protein